MDNKPLYEELWSHNGHTTVWPSYVEIVEIGGRKSETVMISSIARIEVPRIGKMPLHTNDGRKVKVLAKDKQKLQQSILDAMTAAHSRS
jgi:hypothetical protein